MKMNPSIETFYEYDQITKYLYPLTTTTTTTTKQGIRILLK